MNSQTMPAPPMTQKSARKATAAEANDRTLFQATRFGRLGGRVRSLPLRFIAACVELLWNPFAYIGRASRTVPARRPFKVSLRPPLRFPLTVPLRHHGRNGPTE